MDYIERLVFIVILIKSGFMKTVASIGKAVILPIMIFWGIYPLVANATIRLPGFVRFFISVLNFYVQTNGYTYSGKIKQLG